MIGELIARLKTHRKAAEIRHAEPFRELVRRIAAGQEVDEEQTLAILDAAEKKPEDLQAAVELHHRRCDQAAKLAKAEAALPEIAAAEREIERLNAQAEKVLRPIREKIALAQERRNAALALEATIGTLRDQLSSTCTDREVLEREAAAAEELKKLVPKRRGLDEDMRQAAGRVRSFEVSLRRSKEEFSRSYMAADQNRWACNVREYQQAIATEEAAQRQLRSQAAALDERIGELQAVIEQCANERLKP